ncbi:transposase [Pseudophaeobacter arcticus]|uniref:transposase n=1 Tax=Pseudophaeobacter arcticus TaxID=385492 RepID=UPI0012B6519A
MRKSRFTEEQIVGILQEYAAGAKVSELCRSSSVKQTIRGIVCRAERNVGRHLVQVESQVWRHDSIRAAAVEGS